MGFCPKAPWGHLNIFTEEVSVQILCLFLMGYLSFYHQSVRVLHILLIQVFFRSCTYDSQEFSSTLSVHFLDGVLGRTKVFLFDKVKLTYLSFVTAFSVLKA